jgi:hypothetical protein
MLFDVECDLPFAIAYSIVLKMQTFWLGESGVAPANFLFFE